MNFLFVAGFVRIRGVSMKGIRILTNPATISSHRSEYSLCTFLRREKRQC
jgi:hypothetical protein